jgi:BMFP domain-containing protein YqiC
MLLNEVQKQRRQNEEQKTIIVRQESKIQDLEARLAKLEAAFAGGH